MSCWSVREGVIGISPFIGQGVRRCVHVESTVLKHTTIVWGALKDTKVWRSETRHTEPVFVGQKDFLAIRLFVNVVISCRNLQRNGIKDTIIIQKVKECVPFPSVLSGIGDISHQHDCLNTLQMISHVLECLLRVFKLSDIPNDSKGHGIVVGVCFLGGCRFEAPYLVRIDARPSSRVVRWRCQSSSVFVPFGFRLFVHLRGDLWQ
mmetsp:Transcript_6651/g.10390  ORF Transcript_6651/g.10390 Transcript_6651/m.10390 type:complete len:206 (-) Transcript_6651:215-832(-)